MRVLVCGGRDYEDRARVFLELDRLNMIYEFTLLIEGGARGADAHAKAWAISRRVQGREFPANWDRNGKAAGFIRNQRMLDKGKPDLVVAFPGGNGTFDMVSRAEWAGVKVIEIEP